MTRWLSPEWFDQTRALVAEEAPFSGLSARIQAEITGGPDGDVACYWAINEGHLETGASGKIDGPDITLTLSWKDASSIGRGDLNPSVAFMQGRLKVGGSMGAMITLLTAMNTPEYQLLGQKIAEVTEF